jgi:hypothetical protein
MSQNHLAKYSVDELQGYFSDFHKDFYGFRPRFGSPEQWRDREWLETEINAIHNAMDEMKETPEGRAQLRAAGWVIEDEPEVIDPEEYANWAADQDAQYYAEMQ